MLRKELYYVRSKAGYLAVYPGYPNRHGNVRPGSFTWRWYKKFDPKNVTGFSRKEDALEKASFFAQDFPVRVVTIGLSE